jgi:acetyl esterase/lipase
MRAGRIGQATGAPVRRRRLAPLALTMALPALVMGACLSGPPVGASAPRAIAHAERGPSWQGLRTVIYRTRDALPLTMSLFAPATTQRRVPVVLEVHGGGWQHGHRLRSLADSAVATDLVAAGFMVASIDYRLAPASPWPDQMIDVVAAVRYLRAHAAELGIDPNRIAALGDSAGGQLVSLLGTAPDQPAWAQGSDQAISSRVDAVVDEFGPAQLNDDDWPHGTALMIRTVFGAFPTTTNPVLKAASPLTYVAPGDPPFLIVQGTADRVVPESQSEALASRLRAAGVPVDLVLVDGGDHGLGTPVERPSPSAIASLITAFLVRRVLG